MRFRLMLEDCFRVVAFESTIGRDQGDRLPGRAACNRHAVLDHFGKDGDILTARHNGVPVASVLTLYHNEIAMPYRGGGKRVARAHRANERIYFTLAGHARRRRPPVLASRIGLAIARGWG